MKNLVRERRWFIFIAVGLAIVLISGRVKMKWDMKSMKSEINQVQSSASPPIIFVRNDSGTAGWWIPRYMLKETPGIGHQQVFDGWGRPCGWVSKQELAKAWKKIITPQDGELYARATLSGAYNLAETIERFEQLGIKIGEAPSKEEIIILENAWRSAMMEEIRQRWLLAHRPPETVLVLLIVFFVLLWFAGLILSKTWRR